jgi:hypothetical protein
MRENHRRAAPAIDPTKKSSLFEVPLSRFQASAASPHGRADFTA